MRGTKHTPANFELFWRNLNFLRSMSRASADPLVIYAMGSGLSFRSESPESLWGEVKDYLKRRGELLNEEVRNYPTPIAGCDDQLTDLLERRTRAAKDMRRMDALKGQRLSPGDYVALIEEFIQSPSYSRDETEDRLKARLRAQLQELLIEADVDSVCCL